MQRRVWIVLLFVLLITITIVEAHTGAPLPFDLIIQKNITIPWLTEVNINPAAEFTKLEGSGFCKAVKGGYSEYGVQLIHNGTIVKTLRRDVVGGARAPWYAFFELGNTKADTAKFSGVNCCPPDVCGYSSGGLEAIRTITTIPFPDKVKINEKIDEPIGSLSTYLLEQKDRVLKQGEKFQVASSNPHVLVWIGRDEAYEQQTTQGIDLENEYQQPIYACADLDQNRKCDYVEAQTDNCAGDWYKGTCCKAERINTVGCGIYENAYCGRSTTFVEIGTQQYNTFFAMPEEIGSIHVFDNCAQPLNVVYDELRMPHKCEQTSTAEILTIKNHQYYCEPTIPKFTECGGEKPHSITNSLKTGQTLTIEGKINYCLENAQFSTNLDGTTQKSCEQAGFSWTGTRCCSEADDSEEYYNDKPNATNTNTPGGCWNSTFVRSGTHALNYTNNTKEDKSIINYNGSFYGCETTNQQLLTLQNTDVHASQEIITEIRQPTTPPCIPEPENTQQKCTDNQDNDCDNLIDANDPNCTGQQEICDAIDNNLDGQIDENLGATTCGTGACQRTVQNCVDGQVQTCVPGSTSSEVCDGVDNDCDGFVDENIAPIETGTDTGACQKEIKTCDSGVMRITQTGINAIAEVCGNGIDENCDGQDETCQQIFEIIANHSNKCLTVSGALQQNRANIEQWDCYNSNNQKWNITIVGQGIFELRAMHSNKCLTVWNAGIENGQNVEQLDCQQVNNQKWNITPISWQEGMFELRAIHSNKCLTVRNAGFENGQNVEQWACVHGNNQHWRISGFTIPK